jgi:hypothetical protein
MAVVAELSFETAAEVSSACRGRRLEIVGLVSTRRRGNAKLVADTRLGPDGCTRYMAGLEQEQVKTLRSSRPPDNQAATI